MTKASPSWRMLNHRVLQHRCAPVPSPATERSKSALRQTITYVKFIEKFRLTLSHEGTTHCDLSKLRARHTKRHMNEGNAKKGPEAVRGRIPLALTHVLLGPARRVRRAGWGLVTAAGFGRRSRSAARRGEGSGRASSSRSLAIGRTRGLAARGWQSCRTDRGLAVLSRQQRNACDGDRSYPRRSSFPSVTPPSPQCPPPTLSRGSARLARCHNAVRGTPRRTSLPPAPSRTFARSSSLGRPCRSPSGR